MTKEKTIEFSALPYTLFQVYRKDGEIHVSNGFRSSTARRASQRLRDYVKDAIDKGLNIKKIGEHYWWKSQHGRLMMIYIGKTDGSDGCLKKILEAYKRDEGQFDETLRVSDYHVVVRQDGRDFNCDGKFDWKQSYPNVGEPVTFIANTVGLAADNTTFVWGKEKREYKVVSREIEKAPCDSLKDTLIINIA